MYKAEDLQEQDLASPKRSYGPSTFHLSLFLSTAQALSFHHPDQSLTFALLSIR